MTNKITKPTPADYEKADELILKLDGSGIGVIHAQGGGFDVWIDGDGREYIAQTIASARPTQKQLSVIEAARQHWICATEDNETKLHMAVKSMLGYDT